MLINLDLVGPMMDLHYSGDDRIQAEAQFWEEFEGMTEDSDFLGRASLLLSDRVGGALYAEASNDAMLFGQEGKAWRYLISGLSQPKTPWGYWKLPVIWFEVALLKMLIAISSILFLFLCLILISFYHSTFSKLALTIW